MRRLSSFLALGLLATTAVVTATVPAVADQSPPEVTVVERGDGPRTELRYALTTGDEQLVKMRVLTRISQQVGDQPARSGSSPAIDFDIRTTITEVAADGVISATYVYEAVDVSDGSGSEQVLEQIEPIVGLVGTLTMTDQGQVLTSEVTPPPDADEAIINLIEQLSGQASALTVPLPTEKVGKGAQWNAKSETALNGITLQQRTAYELTSSKGTRVELTSTLVQRAKRQTYTDPGTGEEVELLSSDGEGDGESSVRLDRLMPVESEAHVQVRQKLRADGQRISQTVTTHVFIKPA
jgi:hypothetical protein